MRVSDRFSKRFVGSQDTVETREVAIFVFNEVLGVNSIFFPGKILRLMVIFEPGGIFGASIPHYVCHTFTLINIVGVY